MNKKIKLSGRAASVAASAALLVGCGNQTFKKSWVHDNLNGIVSISERANVSPPALWRGDGVSLTLDQGEMSASLLRSKIGKSKLVMVSFKPDSEVARYLEDAPSTWAYHADEDSGYALVFVQDNFTRDGLAALAHREQGCGAIEEISLTATLAGAKALTPPVYPEFLSLALVINAQKLASSANILSTIKKLEELGTRHHATDTGLQTPDLVESLFKSAGSKISSLKTEQTSHADASSSVETAQKSVVATIPGVSADQTTIVIGSHLDSINKFGVTQNAPGADDNASGVATLTEVIRIIGEAGLKFERRIEFHAYAAEEVGLIGSGDIAQNYAASGRNVAAMLQVDMNAWNADPTKKTIYLVEQFTSPTLRRSLKDVLNTYMGGDFAVKRLNGGTSDHKSWHNSGFAAVFPFEDPENYNTKIHTEDDTSSVINHTEKSARFAQMIVAFLAHHAGLTQENAAAESLSAFRSKTPKDLFLAVRPGSGEGFYSITVAAPATVDSVEVCFTGSAGSPGCIKERADTARGSDLGGRRVFAVTEEVAVTAGDRIAVFGYDASDKLVALRTARFDKPN